MMQCWHIDRKQRPSFRDIHNEILGMLPKPAEVKQEQAPIRQCEDEKNIYNDSGPFTPDTQQVFATPPEVKEKALFSITVVASNKPIDLEVDSMWSVVNVKEMLQKKGVSLSFLLFAGIKLADESTLRENNVGPNCTLFAF